MKLLCSYFSILLITGFFISCSSNSSDDADHSQMGAKTEQTAKDSSYVVDIIAADFAYGMPTEIPSGWVTFRMENKGKHEHHGIIEKYPDSLGFDRLNKMTMQTMGQDDRTNLNRLRQFKINDFGGPAMLSPGNIGKTTVFLEPGLYVLTCWLETSDKKYHAEKGMRRTFRVTGDKSGATKPKETAGITVSDYFIQINDPIAAGEHTFNVDFQTQQNIHLAKLEQDQSFEVLKKWMEKTRTPSEFTFIGGAEQAPIGMNSTFSATLDPGRYALVTYGYANSGMATEFTIPSEEEAYVPDNDNKVVNPIVNIEMGSGEMDLPKQIPAGLTSLVITNRESESKQYILYLLNEGKTVEEFATFFTEAFINNTINPDEVTWPGDVVGFKLLESGKKHQFKLKIMERDYVFVGPLPTRMPKKSDWSTDLVQGMSGVAE